MTQALKNKQIEKRRGPGREQYEPCSPAPTQDAGSLLPTLPPSLRHCPHLSTLQALYQLPYSP